MRRVGTAVIAALLIVLLFSAVAIGAALRLPSLTGAVWARTFLLFAGLLAAVVVMAALLPWRALRSVARERDSLAESLAARRSPPENVAFPELSRRITAILQENRELAARAAQISAGADREERLAAIGRLAAGLAHELRNPLTTVIGMAALARESLSRETGDDDRMARDLSAIETEARRCEAISESILSFSRTPRIQPAAVRLQALFERPVAGLAIDFQATPEAAVVMADEVLLGRVVANLLSNAKEAGARAIQARAVRSGLNVKLTIADDGRGIPGALLDQLFDAFTTTKTGGLGLGLAICRGIVVAHGGALTVRNRPEGGAEFALTLPVTGAVTGGLAGTEKQAGPDTLAERPGKVV